MTTLTRAAALTVGLAGLALPAAPALAELGTNPAIHVVFAEPTHELLLTTGKTVQVEILEENDREVKTVLHVGTMSAPKTYLRSEIISISEITDSAPGAEAANANENYTRASDEAIPEDALRVYVMELNGRFGWDISKTPVQSAVERAREMNADIIVVKCNNHWKQNEVFDDEMYDDQGEFEYNTAEKIQPVFTSELRAKWEKEPKVVFWVDRAMSGMAFLPLVNPTIYFTSDGRLGGAEGLEGFYGSTGDEVVRDKLESAMGGHIRGMAIAGGYDPKLIDAMTKKSYVLSYKIENGKPVYLEGEAPGDWILLTDDGEGENADTDRQLVRNEGNDALTFDADLAYKLGVSKGTADTLEDLFFEMGIEDRAHVLNDDDDDGESDAARRELDRWSEGIERALRRLRRLQDDIANVQVREMRNDPDGSKARNAARGQRIRLLNEGIQLLNRYGEVLDPNEQVRVNFELQKQQIENERRIDNLQRSNRRGPG